METNNTFYSELTKIRELFHKYGSFDDSNAKLDEIAKYISIYVFYNQSNSRDKVIDLITKYDNNKSFPFIIELKKLFKTVAISDKFRLANNRSVFGDNAMLNIKDDEKDFGYALLRLVINSVDSVLASTNNYDILNECFGHFVRDNFRNHIEDAQYMTPNEAVQTMCDIAFDDIKEFSPSKEDFIVMDPCCGVGSFLSTFYHKNQFYKTFENDKVRLIGQDKVERMIRLSKINMVLANVPNHAVGQGNSITGDSLVNEYLGKVDLILTNPPFGAKFFSNELIELSHTESKFPFLFDTITKNGTSFNSEVLFVDKCIALLKPGGKLLAVLPDSVISSGGVNSILRHRIANSTSVSVRAIIELPAVTFAQAGTRTKTSILYLEKQKQKNKNRTFIAVANQIGFEVSTKKGATVKEEFGINELPEIYNGYKKYKNSSATEAIEVINTNPSCISLDSDHLIENSWTPNHYNASKFLALSSLNKKEIELVKLSSLVKFEGGSRRKEQIAKDNKCISVLHVSDEDLNYEELLTYKPKYPGIKCKSGDILFSKINPRIMRIIVIPEVEFSLSCSSEFEIMNSNCELSNYAIKLLLMLPSVQAQVNTLTSGTSSSHNRIKTVDLGNVLIPLPKKGTALFDDFTNQATDYEHFTKKYNKTKLDMLRVKNKVFESVGC